jgi:hypothetical protein
VPAPLRLSLSLLLVAAACVGPSRHARLSHLSEENRDLYAKYHQFMTERQQDRFLEAPDDAARRGVVEELHVEERLGHYPRYIQDAIWKEEVVVGMDHEAVILAWGAPKDIDRDDPDTAGVRRERWIYERATAEQVRPVRFVLMMVDGRVTEVREKR